MRRPVEENDQRLTPGSKIALAGRIWWTFLLTLVEVRRASLPAAVERIGRVSSARHRRIDPRRLGKVVYRVLHVGNRGPRCLYNALVLYGLLRRQGEAAEVVIGLPLVPADKDAHAWVEIDGRDVGPPPGRANHEELARYG